MAQGERERHMRGGGENWRSISKVGGAGAGAGAGGGRGWSHRDSAGTVSSWFFLVALLCLCLPFPAQTFLATPNKLPSLASRTRASLGALRPPHLALRNTDRAGATSVRMDASRGSSSVPTTASAANDPYGHYQIHQDMLKDEVRTLAYKDAIEKSKALIEGKIVLDVGCGTGILSMFAAQAGAKHVYAVDYSDMVHTAREIVRCNGFEDQITVIQGEIENVTLPVETVDVIISEWMGYCLLYEGMLTSVLSARDRFLCKKGGVMIPDKAHIHAMACDDFLFMEDPIGKPFWDNVYGFNMSCVRAKMGGEAIVDEVDSDQVVTDTAVIASLDMMTCTEKDLVIETPFTLQAEENGYLHAIVLYFETGFTFGSEDEVWLSTSPWEPLTHWRQTILYLEDELLIQQGQELHGVIKIEPARTNRRHLDIRLAYTFEGGAVNRINQEPGQSHSASHFYRLS